MFQQCSGCRKHKNITYFVNITLPTSYMDSRRATGFTRLEMQGPAPSWAQDLALATNTWQCYREAENAPDEKEKNTRLVERWRKHQRGVCKGHKKSTRSQPLPPTLKQKGKQQKQRKNFNAIGPHNKKNMWCGKQSSSLRCCTEMTAHQSTKLYEVARRGNCVLRLCCSGRGSWTPSTAPGACLPPDQTPMLLEDLPLDNQCSRPEHGKEESKCPLDS